jgi:hypothetical protein
MLLYFIHPVLLDVGEGVTLGQIKNDDDDLAATVVGARDGSELLLPRGVPDLEFYLLAVDFDYFEPEVDSDS